MIFKEDNTYRELCERSVSQWLEEMSNHEDLAVRGGVRVTMDYIENLKHQINALEEKNLHKDQYLKQMKEKYKK